MTSPTSLPHGEICVAVYRPDPELLATQLSSIARQSLQTWTCHIGIDGEDAATASLVAELVDGDSRFVIHHFTNNVGFYRNFERIIKEVSPEAHWFALADQDDFWHPEKLERLVDELNRRDAMAVSGQARVVTGEGTHIALTNRVETDLASLLFDNQVTGSFTVFRTAILDVALPFPDPTDAAYHDHWLGLTAKTLGTVEFLADCLQDYVQHDANVLGEEQAGDLGGRIKALQARGRSGGGALRYLAIHRWGWRVTVSRTLLSRVGDTDTTAVLRPMARGRLSIRVIRNLAKATLKRELPIGRCIGLLAGALGWSIYDPDQARLSGGQHSD